MMGGGHIPTAVVPGFGKMQRATSGVGRNERCSVAEVYASLLLAVVIYGSRFFLRA